MCPAGHHVYQFRGPGPPPCPGTVEPNPFLAGAGLEDEDLGPEAPPPPPGRAAQDGLAHSMRPTSLAGSGCRLMVRLYYGTPWAEGGPRSLPVPASEKGPGHLVDESGKIDRFRLQEAPELAGNAITAVPLQHPMARRLPGRGLRQAPIALPSGGS